MDSLPPPTAAGQSEDLPAGATCRIGSTRLRASSVFKAYFLDADRIFVPSTDEWVTFDRHSGKRIEALKPKDRAVLFSPTGHLAIVDRDKSIALVDTLSQQSIAESTKLAGTNWDRSLMGQDGDDVTLAAFSSKTAFVLYNRRLDYQSYVRMPGRIAQAAISANGKRLAVRGYTTEDGQTYEDVLHIFDTTDGKELKKIPIVGLGFDTLALSARGDLLALSEGSRIRIISLDAESPEKVLDGQLNGVRELLFSPFEKRLIVEAYDGAGAFAAFMFDVRSGKRLWAHGGLWHAFPMAFSPDGSVVVLAQVEAVRLFDAVRGEEKLANGGFHEIEDVDISASGERVVIRSHGFLSWWSTRDCALEKAMPSHINTSRFVVSNDGTEAFQLGESKLWKHSVRGTEEYLEIKKARHFYHLTMSPDGQSLLIAIETESKPQITQLVVIEREKLVEKKRVTLSLRGSVESIRFTVDGQTALVEGSVDGKITEVKTKNWSVVRTRGQKPEDNAWIPEPTALAKFPGLKAHGTHAGIVCAKSSCLVVPLPDQK